MDLQQAYDTLMSANPWSQYSGSVGLRNFAAAAQATAADLRKQGAAAATNSGTSGAAAQDQAEAHARWFDQVATSSTATADKLDALVKDGYTHQTTGETAMASYQQSVRNASGPAPSDRADVAMIHSMQNNGTVMNNAVNQWSDSYSGFTPAPAPPPPSDVGSGTGTGAGSHSGSSSGSGSYAGSTGGSGSYHNPSSAGAHLAATGAAGGGLYAISKVPNRGAGDPGSVTVPASGGDFANWFKDPTTGYYVDPSTGREFDPVTSRWIDPVTGKPFGDVTQYATSLQGAGGPSLTGGLLGDVGGAGGLGLGGGAGGAGGLSGLFTAGNTAGVAGAYGGMIPPSLANGSAAAGSLWQQAGRSLGVKQQVASSMLAREEAARTGRPYLPATQAGAGGGAGAAGSRSRPGYATAAEEEAGLFSSGRGASGTLGGLGAEEEFAAGGVGGPGARSGANLAAEEALPVGARAGVGARSTGVAAEEAAAGTAGRRAYLPPSQAGTGSGEDKKGTRDRPDWLVDDDLFGAEAAPSGVLGD